MLKHILVPDDVVLMNFASGKRLQRSSGVIDDDGHSTACATCGRLDRVVLEEDPAYSMSRWHEAYVFADERMSGEETEANGKKKVVPAGSKMVETMAAVRKAFANAKPGDEIAVAKPYWDTIVNILEKPGSLFPMLQKSQFASFEAAWKDAKDEPRAKALPPVTEQRALDQASAQA